MKSPVWFYSCACGKVCVGDLCAHQVCVFVYVRASKQARVIWRLHAFCACAQLAPRELVRRHRSRSFSFSRNRTRAHMCALVSVVGWAGPQPDFTAVDSRARTSAPRAPQPALSTARALHSRAHFSAVKSSPAVTRACEHSVLTNGNLHVCAKCISSTAGFFGCANPAAAAAAAGFFSAVAAAVALSHSRNAQPSHKNERTANNTSASASKEAARRDEREKETGANGATRAMSKFHLSARRAGFLILARAPSLAYSHIFMQRLL